MSNFKVGDRVRCVNLDRHVCYSGSNWGKEVGLTIGKVYTLVSITISNDGFRWVSLEGKNNYDVAASHFELAGEPHVHCKTIKAWAEGAKVDRFCTNLYEWQPVLYPTWRRHDNYRIRPNKTDKDLQIEELERQAKQLASDITKLRDMGG